MKSAVARFKKFSCKKKKKLILLLSSFSPTIANKSLLENRHMENGNYWELPQKSVRANSLQSCLTLRPYGPYASLPLYHY